MNSEERGTISGTAQQTNQVMPFYFNGHTVRIQFDEDVSWFVAADVCNVLDSDEHNLDLDDVDDNDKGWYSGYPTTFFVNESGLYKLILQSRKPDAEQFKTWVFNEILPEKLREYDRYLEVVKKDGLALKHVPVMYKTYKVCFAAVKQNGLALEHVPEEHISDPLCLEAVKQTGAALRLVPARWWTFDLVVESHKS
jgi:hypothetical protein